jgi:decaprenyl-phosphate phosphoribosyltransferase
VASKPALILRSASQPAKCWVCGSAQSSFWKDSSLSTALLPQDLAITSKDYGQTLRLLKCEDCGMVFADSGELERVRDLYADMSDDGYLSSLPSRRAQMIHLLKLALAHAPGAKTLLDVGAGAGLLLSEASQRGISGVGVELSRSLCESGRKQFGVELIQGIFPCPQLAGRKFDLIFLVDVIEHVPNPVEILRAAREQLSEQGRLLVVTPDRGSLAATLMGKRWWHYRLAHIGYFNRSTLDLAASNAGLEIVHRFRPNWVLPFAYLLSRLAQYVPWLQPPKWLEKMPVLGKILDWPVPFNLFDSLGVVSARETRTVQAEPVNSAKPTVRGHLKIMRLDHWIKNVFVLPGIVLGYALQGAPPLAGLGWRSLLGICAVCLVASGNYVLNELLDAASDRFHPSKRQRPVPSGQVSLPLAYGQFLALIGLGIWLGWGISPAFGVSVSSLALMGLIYNVPPVRSKNRAFLDVLSEAVNNPIRLLCGWYVVGDLGAPPLSFLISYWMIGAYLMALKRFAEIREFESREVAARYRPSLGFYTDKTLLYSALFYACTSMLFFGGATFRYRLELLLSYPLIAAVMTIYLHVANKPNGAAHAPETLYRERALMFTVCLCILVMTLLMYWDIPWLKTLFAPTFGR